ncbi:hypothetical protein [Lysinibacillus xylanilyticus]|uniref:hypothetical protein n=1 Tax=Lysinibacillus xylanilyticus TaxID=582475 RepID=UPI00380ADBBA
MRESVVLTQRQQHDVGHEGVITGRDGFSLRSPFADPQGVAQPPLQSTNTLYMFKQMSSTTFGDESKY